ncbi:MAG: CD225/dispanin family protein [Planctomycetota bacterium]
MYCPNCGTQNDHQAYSCTACNDILPRPYPAPGAGGDRIPTHLGMAILTTLLCFPPLGIVAIVFSAKVNSRIAAGDIEGAREASRSAQNWCWAAVGIGVLLWALGRRAMLDLW